MKQPPYFFHPGKHPASIAGSAHPGDTTPAGQTGLGHPEAYAGPDPAQAGHQHRSVLAGVLPAAVYAAQPRLLDHVLRVHLNDTAES